ncbi:HAD-IIA family hydrolase [Ectobacillus panaciterrae]|uniref:HAD-IIA family hydrolase n=1 Tax=Ectobacillus panaciterrae TaxID=363872 RepID=UPI000425DB58|nr:HAD-IIA family hydrolase [Ectobacillus panaciterrae]
MRNNYSLYFLDIDGTLVQGRNLLPMAKTLIHHLHQEGKQFFYVTNHPVRSHEEHVEFLTKLGLPIKQEELITPLDALKRFFSKVDEPFSIYVAGSTMIKRKLRNWKLPVIERSYEQYGKCFVVLGMAFNLNYAILQEAYQCIQKGATLLVLNPDTACPSTDYRLLDTGSFLKLFEASGDLRKEPIIIGKPSIWMQEVLAEKIHVPRNEVVIIGDSTLSDIAIGNSLGIDSILLSHTTDGQLSDKSWTPTYNITSIKELVESWR